MDPMGIPPVHGVFLRGEFKEKVSLTLTLFAKIHNRDAIVSEISGANPHSGNGAMGKRSVVNVTRSAGRAPVFENDAFDTGCSKNREGSDFSFGEIGGDIEVVTGPHGSVGLNLRGYSRSR
jgi:hypothetical protein